MTDLTALLDRCLKSNESFPWVKKGILFDSVSGEFTHGSHPCAINIGGDMFVIAFTRRDSSRRSHIFLVPARVNEGHIELLDEPKVSLLPGAPGSFDCDGTISVCFVEHRGKFYLYYVGWQNLPDGLWICDTGRAILDPGNMSLRKEFEGPVLGRDKHNPLFAAATAFHVSDDNWQTWYNSGLRWEKTEDGSWKHFYGIHYATSSDGVDWKCEPGLVLPFKDEYEYAFGRPSVIKIEETYYMWYAHRATKDIEAYRIGFAHSFDGYKWIRQDESAGINVSETGWDSEMVCYPCVFIHKDKAYMLYNGNSYGLTGFGYAVMSCGQ